MTVLAIHPRPLSRPLQTALESGLTADERRRIARRLGGALVAGVLLVAGLAHRYLVPGQAEITAVLLALGAVVAMSPVLVAGVRGFVARDPNSAVDQLVSLALLAAAAVGEFETAILVPLVMEIGHFFEERSILGARAAIEGLKTLRPDTAARLGARGEEAVGVEDLRLGDRIVVRPGEAFPADGRVGRGRSAVDQRTMTGEAVAEEVPPRFPGVRRDPQPVGCPRGRGDRPRRGDRARPDCRAAPGRRAGQGADRPADRAIHSGTIRPRYSWSPPRCWPSLRISLEPSRSWWSAARARSSSRAPRP